MLQAGWYFSLAFLLFILVFEYRLIRHHCTKCYYWGKYCAFGRGRISAWFFKKGDPSQFCLKEITWKDMIPDVLITLIPMVAGIVLLIVDFRIALLLVLILLILLTTLGNAHVRGKLACRYCKQQELGCPAEALFKKADKT